MHSIVDNRAGGRFGIGVACAVATPGRVPDLVGKLGGNAVGKGRVDINVAWASLVQDGTAVSTGRGSGFSLWRLTVVRSRDLRPGRASVASGLSGGWGGLEAGGCGAIACGRFGVKSAWLRVPVFGEGVEPGAGGHGRWRRRTGCCDALILYP